jgi:trehalose synthase-fused probable maltokinase
MSEGAFRLDLLPEAELLVFVRGQRWFASKSRDLVGLEILDFAELRASEPPLGLALIELRYAEGPADIYQLFVGARSQPTFSGGEIASAAGLTSYEAFNDPLFAHELADLLRDGSDVAARNGTISFHGEPAFPLGSSNRFESRVLGVEQSNSSLVLGDELIVKAYRRLEDGINPEVEVLEYFARHGFENVPKLWGWWSYESPRLHASLGIAQQLVRDAVDGWALALAELVSAPAALVPRLRRLGAVIGEMHTILASELDDPAFTPEQASPDSLALLAQTVSEESERVLGTLPGGAAVAPISGRSDDIREILGGLTAAGSVGSLIRTHSDLHLGQLLWSHGDWIVIDFEGEPARPLPERRLKQSPLRDVAGMLRSFAYAIATVDLVEPGTESRMRDAFLDSYFTAVRSSAILPDQAVVERSLRIFELEKAVYELRYELANRPDWVPVPVRGIVRLLEGRT